MITSSQHAKIRLARALLGRARERREASAFVVEGVRLVEEAVNSGWKILFALYDETLSERGRLQVAGLRSRGVDVEVVSESLMKSLSETDTPQGILAVLELTQRPIPPARGRREARRRGTFVTLLMEYSMVSGKCHFIRGIFVLEN